MPFPRDNALLRIRKVPGSHHGQQTGYPDIPLAVFFSSHSNSGAVPQTDHYRFLPHTFRFIYHPYYSGIQATV
jgi:hypothetical protein